MNYKIEIEKIIIELGIDIERSLRDEEVAGPFDDEWAESQKLKLQVKEDLQDIIDRLDFIYEMNNK